MSHPANYFDSPDAHRVTAGIPEAMPDCPDCAGLAPDCGACRGTGRTARPLLSDAEDAAYELAHYLTETDPYPTDYLPEVLARVRPLIEALGLTQDDLFPNPGSAGQHGVKPCDASGVTAPEPGGSTKPVCGGHSPGSIIHEREARNG